MNTVTLVDRTEMIEKLMGHLKLNPKSTAIITVDMHRGHLDPAVATQPAHPADAVRIIAAGKDALIFARVLNIPVIHVKLTFRTIPGLGSEGMSAPFWAAISSIENKKNRLAPERTTTVNEHNIIGSPGTELIPELYEQTDYVVDNKKRLDCFMGTDLDMLQRNLGIKSVCLMGINTNTCVLNTAFTAHNHNYQTIVLSDCVAGMYGGDLHELGLQNIKRCLGWVWTNEEFKQKLEE